MSLNLKTLADFKRALAVPGVVLQLVENTAAPQPPDHPAWQPRTIEKLQGNGWYSRINGKKWWMDFGKASEWEFAGNRASNVRLKGRITFEVILP